MNEPQPRTRLTQLTDDELLLMDVLYSGYHAQRVLRADVYSEYENVLYTHGFSDDALNEWVDAGVASGWLWRKTVEFLGAPTQVVTLSDAGGKLWELERRPDWQSFVQTRLSELGVFTRGAQCIYCVDESIGRRCAGGLFASGEVTPAGPISMRRIGMKRLLPWKQFDSVVLLRFRTLDHIDRHSARHNNVYEISRCWWRCLSELNRASSDGALQAMDSIPMQSTTASRR